MSLTETLGTLGTLGTLLVMTTEPEPEIHKFEILEIPPPKPPMQVTTWGFTGDLTTEVNTLFKAQDQDSKVKAWVVRTVAHIGNWWVKDKGAHQVREGLFKEVGRQLLELVGDCDANANAMSLVLSYICRTNSLRVFESFDIIIRWIGELGKTEHPQIHVTQFTSVGYPLAKLLTPFGVIAPKKVQTLLQSLKNEKVLELLRRIFTPPALELMKSGTFSFLMYSILSVGLPAVEMANSHFLSMKHDMELTFWKRDDKAQEAASKAEAKRHTEAKEAEAKRQAEAKEAEAKRQAEAKEVEAKRQAEAKEVEAKRQAEAKEAEAKRQAEAKKTEVERREMSDEELKQMLRNFFARPDDAGDAAAAAEAAEAAAAAGSRQTSTREPAAATAATAAAAAAAAAAATAATAAAAPVNPVLTRVRLFL